MPKGDHSERSSRESELRQGNAPIASEEQGEGDQSEERDCEQETVPRGLQNQFVIAIPIRVDQDERKGSDLEDRVSETGNAEVQSDIRAGRQWIEERNRSDDEISEQVREDSDGEGEAWSSEEVCENQNNRDDYYQ